MVNQARSGLRILAAAGSVATALYVLFAAGLRPAPLSSSATAGEPISYARQVRPILETKCVSCHSCYDAPCQLILSSYEGLLRGASENPVYDTTRLGNMAPTRLFIDAQDTADWRQKGFHPVIDQAAGARAADPARSLLYRMLTLGRDHALAPNTPVPDDIELGLVRDDVCPTLEGFEAYAEARPLQGMPLTMTRLSDPEFEIIEAWLREGAVIDEVYAPPTAAEGEQIAVWEAFLNELGPRNQLVSRYIYEHWFLSHLYFPDLETGHFFELVRSSTASGQAIVPIATVRPNDDPGGPFHYRLRKINGTILHKTHLPLDLTSTRLAQLKAWLLDTDWTLEALPPYGGDGEAVNPFATFAAIPARSRYAFLLQDAEHYIRNFIRGPVCAGQVATDVIDDQFYILFQDPDHDLSVTNADYMTRIAPLLEMPGEDFDAIDLGTDWLHFRTARNDYVRLRDERYALANPNGPDLTAIWDGDGHNQSAMLTVFRHFDNASVVSGFVGALPKTIWVMDYPLLERGFYELVVQFNVFGNVGHQAATRLYFDLIRAGSENNFLRFMPRGVRAEMRSSWYDGLSGRVKLHWDYEVNEEDVESAVRYETDDPKQEFVARVTDRLGAAAGAPDVLNRCRQAPCTSPGAGPARARMEAAIARLTGHPAKDAPFTLYLPDVAFLRVDSPASDQAFMISLVRNRAHTNVAFMFGEDDRLRPEQDTVTAYEGALSSYPNFFFHVPLEQIEPFAEALLAVTEEADFTALVERYGIRRTHPEIWDNLQWFSDHAYREDPVRAGLFDMTRYGNP